MNALQEKLRLNMLELGVTDIGFSRLPEEDLTYSGGLPYAVTLVVKLSDAIVEEITDRPTHTYFNHYRSVNAFLDHALLRAGLLLDQAGWQYITVGASQSINLDGWDYRGRYSHKKAACLAGLGTVGRNSLFLHRQYGPRVRLGTVFAGPGLAAKEQDWETPVGLQVQPDPQCAQCGACAAACPAQAITGEAWAPGVPRVELLNPQACSEHMKNTYQAIGRGAVCGICMRVCPKGRVTAGGGK